MLSHVVISILPYLKRRCSDVVLPDPGGESSRRIPSNAISSANRHVAEILMHTKRPQRKYNSYMPELRAEIGKVASQIGIKAAAICFYSHMMTQFEYINHGSQSVSDCFLGLIGTTICYNSTGVF